MKPLIPDFPVVKFQFTDDFAIHGFGIMVALGFIAGSRMAMNKAARDGLDPDVINRIVGWLVAGVFIGGHLGHLLFYYPEQLRDDPMVLFRVWEGLSSFGGFIGCTVLGLWFLRKEGARIKAENRKRKAAGEPLAPPMTIWGYADSMLYGFSIGWALGRTGCFLAHDHPGTVTNFWLGVYGMCENPVTGARMHSLGSQCDSVGTCLTKAQYLLTQPVDPAFGQACHDLGLYEALWSYALIPLFIWLDRKPRFPGFFVAVWLGMYGPLRLLFDAFRTSDTRYFGVTPAQMGCVVMVLGAAWILSANRNKTPTRVKYARFLGGGGPSGGGGGSSPAPTSGAEGDAVSAASASASLDAAGPDDAPAAEGESDAVDAPTELLRVPPQS